MTASKPTRVQCNIPFCKRTTANFDYEAAWPDTGWICQKHWGPVPRRMKAVKSRCKRALNKVPKHQRVASTELVRFMRISQRVSRHALFLAGMEA